MKNERQIEDVYHGRVLNIRNYPRLGGDFSVRPRRNGLGLFGGRRARNTASRPAGVRIYILCDRPLAKGRQKGAHDNAVFRGADVGVHTAGGRFRQNGASRRRGVYALREGARDNAHCRILHSPHRRRHEIQALFENCASLYHVRARGSYGRGVRPALDRVYV